MGDPSLDADVWRVERSTVIPDKSKEQCENTYKVFKEWCETNDQHISESGVICPKARKVENAHSIQY